VTGLSAERKSNCSRRPPANYSGFSAPHPRFLPAMPPLTRRHWIATSSAAAIVPLPRALAALAGPGWTVGCFNRPLTNRSYD